MLTIVCLLGLTLNGGETLQKSPKSFELEAKAMVKKLSSREFEAVVGRLEESLARVLTEDKLSAIWDSIIKQVGAFQRVEKTRAERLGGDEVVFVTCVFQSSKLDVRITFDSKGRVAGLKFVAPGQKSQWKAPSYANEDAFQEQRVVVGEDPWPLLGTLSIPEGDGPFPAVILVHGSGANDQDETKGPNKPFKDLAWGLASDGVMVLRYTKRNRQHPERFAKLKSTTVNDEVIDDAHASVALLAKHPKVDSGRIYILGHSLGGMVAPRIAQGEKRVAGLILMGANTRPLEQLIVEQATYLANLDGKVNEKERARITAVQDSAQAIRDSDLKPEDTVRLLGVDTPGSYWLDLRRYNPTSTAVSLRIPILVLHGNRDWQVTEPDFEGWQSALGDRSNVTLKRYANLNHLFIAGSGPPTGNEYFTPGNVAPEIVDDIVRWIEKIGPLLSGPK